MINAKLKRFEFEYDDHNNLVKAINPLDQYVTALYNTDQLPIQSTDQEDRTSAAEYDNEGRVLTSTDRAGNIISYTYSQDDTSPAPSSMPVTVTYPTFTRHLTYDVRYRVVKETDVLNDTTTRTRTFTFDDAGNLAASADEAGRITTYEYDALNRLVRTVAPDNGETVRTYDSRDNLIMLQDANNGIQYFTYDKNNRLLTSAKPMGALTRYEYDAVGNKTAVVDTKGQRIEYTYSSENRLTRTRYFEAGDHATPVQTVDFTYDSLGNLLTWHNGTESAEYTYDDLGRKLTEAVNYGSFILSHAYAYTPSGAVKTFTGPDGTPLSYDYDTGGRLAGITLPGAGQAGISYNPAAWNNPVALGLPGGARQDYTYDSLMRIDTVTASDPGGNVLMTRDYTYDAPGNITTKATEHGVYTYAYDPMNRLATALNPDLPDESYTYDNLGNRITDVKIPGQITYNADNQLESCGITGYHYDDNGNMTRKTSGADVTALFYNIEDRLEKVEDDSGNVTAEYGYDPFGRRLWKQVSGTRTYFHYSSEGLVGEYNAAGLEIKAYGYKPGSQWTTDPLFMRIGSEYYWYQNDASGTPQKLIASNGLVVWEGRYDSFGNCRVVIEGITNNLRFAGQYFDAETGLHYNLNRYYDPEIGRYLRVDPFGDGLNLYAYCFNNPNALIDPLGLCALKDPHNWLAGIGLIPGFGIAADLADAFLYLLEGEYGYAAMAGVAAIPLVGYIPRITQYGGKLLKPLLKPLMNEVGAVTIKFGKAPKSAAETLVRSGPIPRSVGAMSRAEQLARKLKLNVNSPTTRQVLNSLDDKVANFVGQFRKGSIKGRLPSEVMDMTVKDALKHSTTVRKLLIDKRFVK